MSDWSDLVIRLHRLSGVVDLDWSLIAYDVESLRGLGCYAENGAPIKCIKCGHDKFIEEVEDYIDVGIGFGIGPTSEMSLWCALCDTKVGYWSYGYYDPAFIQGY